MTDIDAQFFQQHPQRQARIRKPLRQIGINKQRATAFVDECENEFRSLGEHDRKRRWIIVWRVPPENPHYAVQGAPSLLKIPFLAFADEAIEDTDDVLLPILHTIMTEAAAP